MVLMNKSGIMHRGSVNISEAAQVRRIKCLPYDAGNQSEPSCTYISFFL